MAIPAFSTIFFTWPAATDDLCTCADTMRSMHPRQLHFLQSMTRLLPVVNSARHAWGAVQLSSTGPVLLVQGFGMHAQQVHADCAGTDTRPALNTAASCWAVAVALLPLAEQSNAHADVVTHRNVNPKSTPKPQNPPKNKVEGNPCTGLTTWPPALWQKKAVAQCACQCIGRMHQLLACIVQSTLSKCCHCLKQHNNCRIVPHASMHVFVHPKHVVPHRKPSPCTFVMHVQNDCMTMALPQLLHIDSPSYCTRGHTTTYQHKQLYSSNQSHTSHRGPG